MSPAAIARVFLRAHRKGALATLSSTLAGHPHVSAVSYVSSARGHPLLLLSALAEHTRNLLRDPRVSLLVAEDASDLQAARRLTLLGRAEPAPGSQGARYLRHLPEASDYFRLGDFSLYAIRPLRLRMIGGFADIRWIEGKSYAADAGEFEESEDGILDLWNREHANLLRALCARRDSGAARIELIGLDCDGVDIRADGRILRFDFGQSVSGATEALTALARLAGTGTS